MNADELAAVDVLLGHLSRLLSEVIAQRLALECEDDEAIRFYVEETKKQLTASSSEKFAWLREQLLSMLSDTHPPPLLLTEWEEQLRRLVDGAEEIGGAEE